MDGLRDEITNGMLKRGERLPPEHELATKFSVSRMTIRERGCDRRNPFHPWRRPSASPSDEGRSPRAGNA